MNGDCAFSAGGSKKSRRKVAGLLTGDDVQIGSTRTASAPLAGVRSCDARVDGFNSGGMRAELRLVRGREGVDAVTRASSFGMQARTARSSKVVDLHCADGLTACSGGVVAGLMAQIAELRASAAADRAALGNLRQEHAVQAQLLQAANASLQQAGAALQNSTLLVRRQSEQIEALQQGIQEIQMASLGVAQHACAWQQQCAALLQWGSCWAAHSCSQAAYFSSRLEWQAGESVGCAAGNGCAAGVDYGAGRDREREVEVESAGGTDAGVRNEAAGECGGDGAWTFGCSVEGEGEERSLTAPVPSAILTSDDLMPFPSPSPSLVVSRRALAVLRASLLRPASLCARTSFPHWLGCPFLSAQFYALSSCSSRLMSGAFFPARAAVWVANRDVLGLCGLRRGRCMAARTELTLFAIVAAHEFLCF